MSANVDNDVEIIILLLPLEFVKKTFVFLINISVIENCPVNLNFFGITSAFFGGFNFTTYNIILIPSVKLYL